MVGDAFFTLSLVFSLITGTAAGILSLLTLEILRRSPFGRAVFALSIVMVVFVLYHVMILLSPGSVLIAKTFKSVLFTGVAAFVWIMVWSQIRLRRRTNAEVSA